MQLSELDSTCTLQSDFQTPALTSGSAPVADEDDHGETTNYVSCVNKALTVYTIRPGSGI